MTSDSRRWRIAPTLAALAFASTLSMAAERRVASTNVRIEVPANFEAGRDFAGWWLPSLRASVVVTEVPAPVQEIQRGLSREGLATRGMSELERHDVRIDGRDALLLKVRQVSQGVAFNKWLAVFGDTGVTVTVVGTYPDALEADVAAMMRKAVLSARWQHAEGTPLSAAPRPAPQEAVMRLGSQVAYDDFVQSYLPRPDHKAIAVTNDGIYGFASAQPTPQAARVEAMATCEYHRVRNAGAAPCRLVHAEGRWLP